jgi:hypothetical protein
VGAFTPVYAFPYPATTDAPDGPAQIRSLAERVEVVLPTLPKGVITFTAATRPAPTPGAIGYETDTSRWWYGIRVASVNYWAPPGGAVVASLERTVGMNILDAARVVMSYTADSIDVLGCFTPTNTRYQPTVPGVYTFNALVQFSSDPDGYRAVQFLRKGTSATPAYTAVAKSMASPVGASVVNAGYTVALNGVDDYIEVEALAIPGGGATLTMLGALQATYAAL